MKIHRYLAALCCLVVLPLVLASLIVGKDTKKKIKGDVCSSSNPASICGAANTCGSASTPCSIDIRRSGGTDATATPSIPDAKSNKAFCIKVGTSRHFHEQFQEHRLRRRLRQQRSVRPRRCHHRWRRSPHHRHRQASRMLHLLRRSLHRWHSLRDVRQHRHPADHFRQLILASSVKSR